MLRYLGVEVRVFFDLGFFKLKHIHREDNKVYIIEVIKMVSYLLGIWSTRKLESFRINIKIWASRWWRILNYEHDNTFFITTRVFWHDYVNYGRIQNLCGNNVMTNWSEEHIYPKLLEGRHVIHYCVPIEGLFHTSSFSYIMPWVGPYQHLLIVMTTHLTIKCLALTTL